MFLVFDKKTRAALQLVLFLTLLSGSKLSFAQGQPSAPPPAFVVVDSVKADSLAEQIWVPGTVISRTDANIAAEVAGRLSWVAEVGDVIEKDVPLANIDDELLQLQLQQQDANIEKWKTRVRLLERKQARFGKMAKLNNTSEDEFEEIQSELQVAKQEVAQAIINKQQTSYRLSQTQVKAPFTSLVVARLQSPGEYTSVGNDLLRVVDTNNVEASVRAPLSAVPFISKGLQVKVKSKNIERMQQIRTIVPVGDARSRMMEIRVVLKPGDFPIGSAVRVSLPHSDYHEGVTVPRDALVLRKSGTFVFVVTAENTVRQVSISTGVGVGNRVEVFGDIEPEDKVVVRGAERLRDGQNVRI